MGKISVVPPLAELSEQLFQKKEYSFETSRARVLAEDGQYKFEGDGITVGFRELRSLHEHLGQLLEGSETQDEKMREASQRLGDGMLGSYEGIKLGFDVLGLRERRELLARRYENPKNLIKDYGVIEEARGVLQGLVVTEASLEEFKRQVRREKKILEKQEIELLHDQWKAQGGELKIEQQAGAKYPDLDVVLDAMSRGAQIVSGGGVVESEVYGTIDPSLLNKGLEAFSGSAGQIMLIAALAVVTGRYDYPLQHVPKFLKKIKQSARKLSWNSLNMDWRRGRVIQLNKDKIFKKGLAGYKQFAREYTDGDMFKAHLLASSLLSKEEFRSLRWGKQIQLKIEKVNEYQEVLHQGLMDGSLKGLEGYKTFAREYTDGDMFKAHLLAAALLSIDELNLLGWGKSILLREDQVDLYIKILRQGLRDGSLKGIEGYKKFSSEYANNDMLKGHILASALLSKNDFKKLGWGKQISLKVHQVDEYQIILRQGLKDGSLQGIEGYKKFSKEYANGDMQKGAQLASALLSEQEFKRLGWGKTILLKAEKVSEYQQILRQGLKDGNLKGIEGYEKFSRKYAHGSMFKGHVLASALLTEEEFKGLEWGAVQHKKYVIKNGKGVWVDRSTLNDRWSDDDGVENIKDQIQSRSNKGVSHQAPVVYAGQENTALQLKPQLIESPAGDEAQEATPRIPVKEIMQISPELRMLLMEVGEYLLEMGCEQSLKYVNVFLKQPTREMYNDLDISSGDYEEIARQLADKFGEQAGMKERESNHGSPRMYGWGRFSQNAMSMLLHR